MPEQLPLSEQTHGDSKSQSEFLAADSRLEAVGQAALAAEVELEEPQLIPEGNSNDSAEEDRDLSYSEMMSRVAEAAERRAEQAAEDSEFGASPEVREALKGFYSDHMKMAAMIEYTVDHPGWQPEEQEFEGQFETAAMNGYARNLTELNGDPSHREAALREAQYMTEHILFNEVAVGASTLTDAELDVPDKLAMRIRNAAIEEGLSFTGSDDRHYWYTAQGNRAERLPDDYSMQYGRDLRNYTVNRFWSDTRYAGQLLFHNTGDLAEISKAGNRLMSRSAQIADRGKFNAQTAVYRQGKAHTNVPHFSEEYDYRNYKQFGSTKNITPGTIALPLAEIIKVAPYARNNKYGVVELKPEADANKIVINDGLGDIGPGHNDGVGANGTDRVFFSDYRAEHAQEAHDYVLDFGRGMSTDNGNTSMILMTEAERRREQAGYAYGAGQHLPLVRHLPFDFHPQEFSADRSNLKNELARLARGVKDLQAESRHSRTFEGKVVVPLRGGVMEFDTENMPGNDNFGRFRRQVDHSHIDGSLEAA